MKAAYVVDSRRITIGCIFSMLLPSVYAWDCGSSHEDWAKNANIIFEGNVIKISPRYHSKSQEMSGRDITFEVTNTIYGKKYKEINVSTGLFGISPGHPFLCGSKYLVYSSESANGISTHACYPNKPLDNKLDYAELEQILLVGDSDDSQQQFYLNKLSSCGE